MEDNHYGFQCVDPECGMVVFLLTGGRLAIPGQVPDPRVWGGKNFV